MADISALLKQTIVVVGLGKEGIALALYLANKGATAVTATDAGRVDEATVKQLEAAGVRCVIGSHPPELLDGATILFVSPGVPLNAPFIKEARQQGIPLSTETKLFCYLCPAPILAVTGSSGKSTTTTLLGQMMDASGKTTWVGGNIGRPLIEVVDEIQPSDVVVMELSSFQLEYFRPQLNKKANHGQVGDIIAGWSPPISAILNLTPNHLDRHGEMRSYVRAKRAIIDSQKNDGVMILSLDNDVTERVRWFSLTAEHPQGASLYDGQIILLDGANNRQPVLPVAEMQLKGEHNVSNAMAACLMAREAGATIEAMQTVLRTFSGLPYRLQHIRQHQQVDYYNDSIATTPVRMQVALRAFERPVILLAGGRDKKLSWEDGARTIVHKTEHVILFGEAQPMIAEMVERAKVTTGQETTIHLCDDLAAGVALAHRLSRPNDVVLLSPGCASFDQFPNFAARGDAFNELVQALA